MITALLVSVNYSDYLEVALPYNTKQFDEIIVLTIESDKECQEVCSKHSNVKCLVFPDEILKKNGKTFNKGALLNKGFEYLNEINYSDWLVLTDADTVFPENFKELLLSKEKDPNVLYGINRKYCYNVNKFNAYINTKEPNLLLQMRGLPCMGFCQIFIYKANKVSFVEDCDANNSDVLFLTHFSKQFKTFMDSKINLGRPYVFAEFRQNINNESNFINLSQTDFVIHLGESRKNWKGRITTSFKDKKTGYNSIHNKKG